MYNLAVILLCVILCSPCLIFLIVWLCKRCNRNSVRRKVDIDAGLEKDKREEREEKHDVLLTKKTLKNMLEGKPHVFEDEEQDILGNNTTYFEHSSKFISAEQTTDNIELVEKLGHSSTTRNQKKLLIESEEMSKSIDSYINSPSAAAAVDAVKESFSSPARPKKSKL